jgi:hypothetical protein
MLKTIKNSVFCNSQHVEKHPSAMKIAVYRVIVEGVESCLEPVRNISGSGVGLCAGKREHD